MSLVADDKARSSVWSVCTAENIAALRKHLMDDSRHWVLVSYPRNHVIQECRDLHLELQKVLGKRVCHAKSWNETTLPYMYNTLKSKCVDTSPSDLGRTRPKQGPLSEKNHLLGSTPRARFLPTSLSSSVLNGDAAGRTLLLPMCLNCILSAPASVAEDIWMTTGRSLRMQRNSMKRPKTRSSRPFSGSHAVEN